MKILVYILTPICAYILCILLGFVCALITLPLTWIIFKNNPIFYRFRLDYVVSGVLRGVLVVYLTAYLLSLIETEVSFRWIVISVVFLSYLSIAAWKTANPDAYEFSLNVSPVIGYIIGLFII